MFPSGVLVCGRVLLSHGRPQKRTRSPLPEVRPWTRTLWLTDFLFAACKVLSCCSIHSFNMHFLLCVRCSKATTLERTYGPAWIAYGHSFAVESEHDQAMAAYFTAAQLMKGLVDFFAPLWFRSTVKFINWNWLWSLKLFLTSCIRQVRYSYWHRLFCVCAFWS